jgi:hypothetical protein
MILQLDPPLPLERWFVTTHLSLHLIQPRTRGVARSLFGGHGRESYSSRGRGGANLIVRPLV